VLESQPGHWPDFFFFFVCVCGFSDLFCTNGRVYLRLGNICTLQHDSHFIKLFDTVLSELPTTSLNKPQTLKPEIGVKKKDTRVIERKNVKFSSI
jgi:hypothetical protein